MQVIENLLGQYWIKLAYKTKWFPGQTLISMTLMRYLWKCNSLSDFDNGLYKTSENLSHKIKWLKKFNELQLLYLVTQIRD